MRTIRFLILAAIIVMSASTYAQTRNSSDKNQEKRRSTQTQSARKTDSKSESSNRTTTVTSQPQNIKNKVDRSKVTYKKSEPKVVAVRSTKNKGMKTVSYNNKNYYYDSGVFYRKYNDNYVKVAAPSGMRISTLPQGYVRVSVNGRGYFYFEGIFYSKSNNDYIVETPPLGAIVYALPADYEKVIVDGGIFYEYNGVLYERIRYNGERAYQVVGYID